MVPTFTAIDDATPVGHVPFRPVDVACVASCVTLTLYEPARVPSAAEMNVTSGLADDPPCVNIVGDVRRVRVVRGEELGAVEA